MHINHHPDEDQHLPIVEKVMTDRRPFAVQSTVADVWMMISALQFCTRAPQLHANTRAWFERIARGLVHVIAATHPEAVALAEMGFDPQHDVVRTVGFDYEDDDGPIFGAMFFDDDIDEDDEDEDFDDYPDQDDDSGLGGGGPVPDYPDHDEDF